MINFAWLYLVSYIFRESGYGLFTESSHKSFFKRLKNSENLDFKKASDQKDWNLCNRVGIIIPTSATYYLKVSAQVSLQVATSTFRGKNNLKI